MKTNIDSVLRIIAPTVPYVAVIAGMHFLRSGWTAVLSYHIGMCLVLSVAGGRPLARKLVSGWNGRIGVIVILMCSLGGPLVYWLWPHMSLEYLDLRSGLVAVGLARGSWLCFVVYYCLVNPWLEELYWRGFLAANMNYGGLSDILYSGYHVLVLVLFVKLSWVVVALIVLTCVSRLWRQLAARYDGLLIPALSHLAADISIITAAFILSL